jgi:hypothetical protein
MRLKMRYEHSENQRWAMHQQLLENSRKSSRRKLMILRSNKRNKRDKSMFRTQQVDERCMNDNQLSTETTCVKN